MSDRYPAALERAPCPLGCPAGEDVVLVGRDRLQDLPGEFPVVRCRDCGTLRTSPRPTASAIRIYYPDEYGPYRATAVSAPRSGWRARIARLVWAIFDMKAEVIPPISPGRMLEVGSASGRFLRAMERRGWTVEGIELSAAAAAQARRDGLRVQNATIDEASAPEPPVDLVVAWMVLEHLPDPVSALARLRSWTREGGMLALSVPNADCYEFRLFREHWYTLHLPNHLWHPTPDSLRRVLERGGWRLERVYFHRDLKGVIGSLGYWMGDRGFPRGVGRWLAEYPEHEDRFRLLYFLLFPFARLLAGAGQTGRMTVWARRLD
jgi:SAM-dependent methyltransferase